MKPFSDAELVINGSGRIYHLNLVPDELSETVILVGAPERVADVSSNFDKVLTTVRNREFLTHTGLIGNHRLTVMSTGIGPDNIDIVMNEMDALANIDFVTRMPKARRKALRIVRIGTTGALHEDIAPGSFVVSSHGLGLDGLIYFYKNARDVIDPELTDTFISATAWPSDLPRPYIVEASGELIQRMDGNFHKGITATSPGFYGPQGRELNLKLAYPELNEKLTAFRYKNNRITNFEMESAPLYGLGRMLGHETMTICLVLANRPRKTFLKDYKKPMDSLIKAFLEKMVS